jgi:CheY-like chemotaxis protein
MSDAEKPPGATRGQSSSSPGPKRPARILIVDDDESVGRALYRSLSEYEVVVQSSPVDAVALLDRGERFDVILSDLAMPSMSGCDLLVAIRGLAPEQAGRVVFLTGGARDQETEELLAATGQPVLNKPLAPKALREFIEQFLLAVRPLDGR